MTWLSITRYNPNPKIQQQLGHLIVTSMPSTMEFSPLLNNLTLTVSLQYLHLVGRGNFSSSFACVSNGLLSFYRNFYWRDNSTELHQAAYSIDMYLLHLLSSSKGWDGIYLNKLVSSGFLIPSISQIAY